MGKRLLGLQFLLRSSRQGPIDHFTVVGLVTWLLSLNGSETRVDLVLTQTLLFLLCKVVLMLSNLHLDEKSGGLYQSKVTSSLAFPHGQVTKHTTVKWPIAQ